MLIGSMQDDTSDLAVLVRSSEMVYEQSAIRQTTGPSGKLFRKVEKALDLGNAQRAGLKGEINRLMEDFRAVKPHTRKRVREPADDRFARIKDIIQAEEASQQPPKRRRGATQEEPTPAVQQAQEEIIHGLDRLRQAQEML